MQLPPPPQLDPPTFWRRRGKHLALLAGSLAAVVVGVLLLQRDPGTSAATVVLVGIAGAAMAVSELFSRPPRG